MPVTTAYTQSWPPVPDIDLSKFSPDDFSDAEIDMPYFLKHFHTIANSVVENGPNKGFIDIIVWRAKKTNQPYNARIMENVIALGYFYSTKRPWNIYYGSEPVRLRLEAALQYLAKRQGPQGHFAEYGQNRWNLAATAFYTKFMGQTIKIIKDMPRITPAVLNQAIETDRRAISLVLNDDKMYQSGMVYANQYGNVWGGALAFMSMFPDIAMETIMKTRLSQAREFQSPAGFFYEGGATDFGYNLGTHQSDLWSAYQYSRSTDLEKVFVEEEYNFGEWIKYNAVQEPHTDIFTLNRAIETRQKAPVIVDDFTFRHTPLGIAVPSIRAFLFSKADMAKRVKTERVKLKAGWPKVAPLRVGSSRAYSPYDFLQRDYITWYPTAEEKEASRLKLPYIANAKFNHQKMDSRNPTVFTYVRQPGYYAIFNSGKMMKTQAQRFGIGLLWHPKAGTFLQSQSWVRDMAWGTKPGKGKMYENSTVAAVFSINGKQVNPVPGARDLPEGDLSLSYPLGNAGKKSLTFKAGQIDVSIDHEGVFTEMLPFLLLPQDRLTITAPGKATLTKSGVVITVSYSPTAHAALTTTNQQSGKQHVEVLSIKTRNRLAYTIATN